MEKFILNCEMNTLHSDYEFGQQLQLSILVRSHQNPSRQQDGLHVYDVSYYLYDVESQCRT